MLVEPRGGGGMKFSIVNGRRLEAQPNLSGQCPACDQAMIAKCGEVKLWHWAHKGRRNCDPWWENETDWHRTWKGRFPVEWQEVIHKADDGERHIADIKTDQGWVIEFQHSHLKSEERRSRDAFYQKLVWVVDGTRLKRDAKQFLEAVNRGVPVGGNALIRRVSPDRCVLLREWAGGPGPVFFDFGGGQVLWWLLKSGSDGAAYITTFAQADFIGIHRGGATQEARDFEAFAKDVSNLILRYESHIRAQASGQSAVQLSQARQQYFARRSRSRRRF